MRIQHTSMKCHVLDRNLATHSSLPPSSDRTFSYKVLFLIKQMNHHVTTSTNWIIN